MNISKLMTFILKNNTIFLDISKWNIGKKKWNGESSIDYNTKLQRKIK